MRVDEVDVADIRVENVHIADKRVVHVDHGDETPQAREPGEERFTKSKREPAAAATPAKTGVEAPAAAEETHKGRPIDRRTKERARAPAPAAREIVPPAIVVRSKTPRRIVNPGPAPRADPVPIAIAVGGPARGNLGGIPNMPVPRLIAPGAVIIEVVVADHIARNVTRGNRVVFLQVALRGPTIEAVGTRRPIDVVFDVFRTVEFGALAGMYFIRFAAGGDFTLAAEDGNSGGVAIFIHVNAKCSGLLHGESQVGSVDFVKIAFAEFAHAEIDATFSEAYLCDALVEIEKRHRAHAAEMDGCLAGL